MDLIYFLGWPMDNGQGNAGLGGGPSPGGTQVLTYLFRRIVRR
jgi:hypothetical protein